MADDEPLNEKPEKRARGAFSGFAGRRDKPARRRVLRSRDECEVKSKVPAPTDAPKSVASTPVESSSPALEPPRTFKCALCETDLENGTDTCPGCGSRYVSGVTDSQLTELEDAERQVSDDSLPDVTKNVSTVEPPGVRFDAEAGTVSRLPDEEAVVCGNCGTEIEFEVDKCPMCGAELAEERGIVDLFTDMAFDRDESPEMDCPLCGEHVVLEEGICPSCKEKIQSAEDESDSRRVDPIIHMDNVVFLHLDVSSGEVNLLHRLSRNRGLEQVTVQLDEVGKSGSAKHDENAESE